MNQPDNPAMLPDDIPNAVLRRLIAEVKNDRAEGLVGYNRIHNRHNRSSGRPPVTPPDPKPADSQKLPKN